MAQIFLPLFILSLASAAFGLSADIAADAQSVQKEGAALPETLRQQWAALSTYLHNNFAEAVAKENAAYTEAASKKAVREAVALLQKLVATRFSADVDFKASQTAAVESLVANYTGLIRQRSKTTSKDAGDEEGILALRRDKQALFLRLEQQYQGMLTASRATFRKAFQTVSAKVTGTVRQSVRESADRMLLHLVNNQKKCMGVLTGQFALVEKFAINADNVLWRIAVPAQTSVL